MAVLFGLAEHVGHLPLDRVQALVEGGDRRLGGRGIARETGGVGRTTAWKHLALHLLDLPFEPLDSLFGRDRLALRNGSRRKKREACRCNEQTEVTK